MVQRSRIAPPSDVRSLQQQRREGLPHPGRAALKHLAIAVLLAGAAYASPRLFGPGFFHDQLHGAVAFAASAGEWVRTALVAAFQSIPVR